MGWVSHVLLFGSCNWVELPFLIEKGPDEE
jgi:hypothetical protein